VPIKSATILSGSLAMPAGTGTSDHVYKMLDLVGSSEKSIEDAIQSAISRASKTVRGMRWFEITQMRGHIQDGSVGHYQVELRVGFTLEE
jgi:flavin-binding protein dodecin